MTLKHNIIDTLTKEVMPAMGCTEPVAVALACAKAKELVEYENIKSIDILVSPSIYKNGLGVGVPNSGGEIGLHIAAALGIAAGKSEKGLRVLEGITDEDIIRAKELVSRDIMILTSKDVNEGVYVEVSFNTDAGYSNVVIKGRHDNFVHLQVNDQVIFHKEFNTQKQKTVSNDLYSRSIREIVKEIEGMEYEELIFLMEGIKMNEAIAAVALEEPYGMGVGAAFYKNMKNGVLSNDLVNQAMILTAAGSDARMSGINMPVMSSSGSGNHGLTAILPIVAYKKLNNTDDETTAKALAISHIVTSYIKNFTGRLSSICGCSVAAATGVSAAITWLMGGSYDQIDNAISNMIADISGMVCDGAKVGCALKLATASAAAVQAAILAVNDSAVPGKNGIVADAVEDTIRNLGILASKGMNVTDGVILDIMKSMC